MKVMLLLLWSVWRCPQNEHGCSHKGKWLAKWRGVHWLGRGGRKGLVTVCSWSERRGDVARGGTSPGLLIPFPSPPKDVWMHPMSQLLPSYEQFFLPPALPLRYVQWRQLQVCVKTQELSFGLCILPQGLLLGSSWAKADNGQVKLQWVKCYDSKCLALGFIKG